MLFFEDKLIEFIGKGSFGRVWKAEHIATKKLYAIKIIKFDNAEEKENIDKEEIIFKKLKNSSPYLLELIDSFEEV
jgi:serine/threonine protein kinase